MLQSPRNAARTPACGRDRENRRASQRFRAGDPALPHANGGILGHVFTTGLRMSHPPSQRPVRTSLADRLLHATTPSQVADVLLDDGVASAQPGTCLLWSNH